MVSTLTAQCQAANVAAVARCAVRRSAARAQASNKSPRNTVS